jgi:peptide deformylase
MFPRSLLPLCALLLQACTHTPPTKEKAMTPGGPDIVQAGAPVLRARAVEVQPSAIGTPEFKALVDRMVAAMRAAPGVGLAAPQIGVGLRVVVLEDTAERMASLTETERAERGRTPFPLRVLVNPVLRPVGGQTASFFEGCLSVRGYAAVVTRAHEVEVTGLDETGAAVRWQVSGWPARILQHELDHLDGTLYVDRMHTRTLSTPEQVKARFAGRPVAQVLGELGVHGP